MHGQSTPLQRQRRLAIIYAAAVVVVSIAVAVVGTVATDHTVAVMVAFPLVALAGAVGAAVTTYRVFRQDKPYLPWFATVWFLLVYFLVALSNSGPYLVGAGQ